MASPAAARLLAHGGIYALSRLAGLAVGVVLLPMYARWLGPEGFGVISLMSTIGGLLGTVLVQGLPAAWLRLRFDEADAGGVRAFESTLVWYMAASGLVLVGILTLAGEPLARRVTPGVPFLPLGLLTAVTAFWNAFPALYERRLQVEERPVAVGALSLARTLASAGLVVWFVVGLGRGARGAIEAMALAAALAAIVSLFLMRPASPRAFSLPRLRRSLRYGLPLVPHSLAGMSNDIIDRLILNSMLGLSAVGVYSMGYRLASVGQVFAASFNQAFAPVFIRTLNDADRSRRDGNAAAAGEALRRVARLGLMTVTVVSLAVLAIAAVSREMLLVLATPAFAESWKVVPIVGAGVVAWACYFPFSQAILYNAGRVHWLMIATGLAALANIAANLVLIPRIGILGAATATLFSDVVLALVALRLARSSTPIPYRRSHWLGALAVVAAGLAGLWWMDARIDATGLRIPLKLAWAAAAAVLTLRVSGVSVAMIRELWTRRETRA